MDIKKIIENEIEKQKAKKLEKLNAVFDYMDAIKYGINELKHDIQSIYIDVDLYNAIFELETIQKIDDTITELEKELEKEAN